MYKKVLKLKVYSMRYFHFHSNDPEFLELQYFDAPLKSKQCTETTKSGSRCKRKVVIGTPICFTHLKSKMFLEIANSTIPNAGKGLFARKPSAPNNAVVFEKGDFIANYDGQVISQEELLRRYNQNTAPYAVSLTKKSGLVEDAALSRGVGSLLSHKPRSANVRFSLGRNNRVKIVATRNIKNNQELFVNYGNDYRFDEDVRTSTNNSKWLA